MNIRNSFSIFALIAFAAGCGSSSNVNPNLVNNPNYNFDSGIDLCPPGSHWTVVNLDLAFVCVPNTTRIVHLHLPNLPQFGTVDSGNPVVDGGTSEVDSGDDGATVDGNFPVLDSGNDADTDANVVADSGNPAQDGGAPVDSGTSICDSGSPNIPYGCTYTLGYYNTHGASWYTWQLTLGNQAYDEPAMLVLLDDSDGGDASLILAKQLITSLLNGGANDPNSAATVAQAQVWMTVNANGPLPYGIAASTSVGQQAVALSATLDQYNNGLLGTPHCQ